MIRAKVTNPAARPRPQHGLDLVSTARYGQRDRSGSRPIAPSLGQGTSNANDNTVVDADYIENGIAEIENFLAVKASEESLALA